ncbi:MAG TPA: 30S ribosomal protein S7 [Candidatus Ratteibacteria bacterium]|jgi:small subunit ribosomal protein S7|nr:30S ribosomal protein S7 [bacterium]HQL64904.1 30S ribosomal protein S7 [bacterium]HRS06268.1 30S ribosomal protein S7 [Candidatus Ratteibacteria bacterium]HRV04936.1 30S ribosomal protein S7 [Candidatus Ratteibacteria bacterium]
MPRRKYTPRKTVLIDPKYDDFEIARFINSLMVDGKKTLAEKIMYSCLNELGEKTKEDPLIVFRRALNNVKPRLEVRPRRVGGATYQVPVEVAPKRSLALAIRWILQSARTRKGKPMYQRLVEEIIDASKNEGASVKKREEMHKMAESNRAFAHYRW